MVILFNKHSVSWNFVSHLFCRVTKFSLLTMWLMLDDVYRPRRGLKAVMLSLHKTRLDVSIFIARKFSLEGSTK